MKQNVKRKEKVEIPKKKKFKGDPSTLPDAIESGKMTCGINSTLLLKRVHYTGDVLNTCKFFKIENDIVYLWMDEEFVFSFNIMTDQNIFLKVIKNTQPSTAALLDKVPNQIVMDKKADIRTACPDKGRNTNEIFISVESATAAVAKPDGC